MKTVFLGTSAGVPTRRRFTSAIALDFNDCWALFDAGEGTQFRIRDSKLKLSKLRYIFITHLHGDHLYGLFGVLASRGINRTKKNITIYGIKDLKKIIDIIIELTDLSLSYNINFVEIKDGLTFDFSSFKIQVVELNHSIQSFGFVIKEKDKKAKINGAILKDESIYYKELMKGKSIIVNGEIIRAKDVIIPPKRGKKIIIGGDNNEPERFLKFKNIDLMVHEATYIQKDFDSLKTKYLHTTVKQLAIVASKMGVKKLILTHISPRYYKRREFEILEEAKKFYSGELVLAYDLMELEV